MSIGESPSLSNISVIRFGQRRNRLKRVAPRRIEDEAMTKTPAEWVALMSPPELSDYAGPAVQTLAIWRMKNKGPRYVKIGGRIRYRLSDVDEWLEANTTGGNPA